jgi:hypothetical protein
MSRHVINACVQAWQVPAWTDLHREVVVRLSSRPREAVRWLRHDKFIYVDLKPMLQDCSRTEMLHAAKSKVLDSIQINWPELATECEKERRR